jgi:hypothetical protein
MSGAIYVIQDGKRLIKMELQDYAREEDFQQLLQDFPDLLAGEQIDAASPRRWLLVGREVTIPSEMDGSGRWSLDHLFLDQDAIPTLVEVKRKSDTRLRREVVGQMLDYAANAVAYLPGNAMRDLFSITCEAGGVDPLDELDDFLGEDDEEHDRFWEAAKLNLQQGRVRLVFVADRIPTELQRIVEFLNERMNPTEVLAVEIRRYTGENLSTHIPRVIGQTGEAKLNKRPRTQASEGGGRKWTEANFFEEIKKRVGEQQCRAVASVYEFAKSYSAQFDWGRGTEPSFNPRFSHLSRKISPFTIRSDGMLWIKFTWFSHNDAQVSFRQKYYDELLQAGIPIDEPITQNAKFPIEQWSLWVNQFILATQSAINSLSLKP